VTRALETRSDDAHDSSLNTYPGQGSEGTKQQSQKSAGACGLGRREKGTCWQRQVAEAELLETLAERAYIYIRIHLFMAMLMCSGRV